MRVLSVLIVLLAATPLLAQEATPIVLQKRAVNGLELIDGGLNWSQVTGLKPGGDGYLSVRAGPGPQFAERDRLAGGRFVLAPARKGGWRGVIYGEPGEEFDAVTTRCGLDLAAARRMKTRSAVYAGPCRWGWADSRWLTLIAD